MQFDVRPVERVVSSARQLEGGGFEVRRPFPGGAGDQVDPFLLLDHFGPVDWEPGQAVGAPDHPHRGFETVTYLLSGEQEHRDSQGHRGILGPGDVQWMTAGAGVVHSEMPTAKFMDRGGRMEGFQIWVNLPSDRKMMMPRYQDIPASGIPFHRAKGIEVKVIAGEVGDCRAVIDTVTPILLWDVRLEPAAVLRVPVPGDHVVMAYVYRGEAASEPGDTRWAEGQLAIFAGAAPGILMSCPPSSPVPLRALVLGGAPLGEPVVRYGPFVMNSVEEIQAALRDYRDGRMGAID